MAPPHESTTLTSLRGKVSIGFNVDEYEQPSAQSI